MLKIKPYLLVCQLQDVASLVWRGSQEKDVCFHKFEVLCWGDATGVWSLMSSWPSILGGFNCLYLLCFHLSASGKVCTPLHCHSESWKHVFPAFHSQWRFWKDKVASLYFILFFFWWPCFFLWMLSGLPFIILFWDFLIIYLSIGSSRVEFFLTAIWAL